MNRARVLRCYRFATCGDEMGSCQPKPPAAIFLDQRTIDKAPSLRSDSSALARVVVRRLASSACLDLAEPVRPGGSLGSRVAGRVEILECADRRSKSHRLSNAD